jgi:GT2 family glycosyltransferase
MFTIVIPAYNNPSFTKRAIDAAILSVAAIDLPTRFILIDNAGRTGESTTPVFLDARDRHDERDIVILRAKEETLYYTGAFSLALHFADTPLLLFLSNDMLLTPAYLKATIAVSALSEEFGCIRGSSPYTDGLPEHVVKPPPDVQTHEQMCAFGEQVFTRNGLAFVENDLLCGDAVIVRRSLVEKIGLHDFALGAYFSDIDYGMRAQLAGFKLVGALGAWLHHEGAGYPRREAERQNLPFNEIHRRRMGVVGQSWQRFREKWSQNLPISHQDWAHGNFRQLAEQRRAHVSLKVDMPLAVIDQVEVL